MTLDRFPPASRILIDSTIFIYHATADPDFSHVKDLEMYRPGDLVRNGTRRRAIAPANAASRGQDLGFQFSITVIGEAASSVRVFTRKR